MKEVDFPTLYLDASRVSLNAQNSFLRLVGGSLSLLIVCAVISVVNSPERYVAIAQAFALLLSLSLTAYAAYQQPQRVWYGARALAESVKTVTWRFVMRAEPYNKDDAPARSHFIENLTKIFSDNAVSKQVIAVTIGDQITVAMNNFRALPIPERKQRYEKERIDDQLNWYRNKAEFNRRRSSQLLALLIVVHVLAVFSVIGKVNWPAFSYWPTDIFISIAGSVIAWSQTKRFNELATSYNLTAHEIGLLKSKLKDALSSNDVSEFVGDAENAFSREHTQWRARRDVD